MANLSSDYNPLVVDVAPAGRWSIWVRFSDGVEGIADLSHLRDRAGFEKWSSRRYFRSVHVQGGTAMWGDWDVSVCADVLYSQVTGIALSTLCPTLQTPDGPVKVEDESEDSLYVEYKDGTKGHLKVTDNLKTGREFPVDDSDGLTKVAPWGDIIWKDSIELSSDLVKKSLAEGVAVVS